MTLIDRMRPSYPPGQVTGRTLKGVTGLSGPRLTLVGSRRTDRTLAPGKSWALPEIRLPTKVLLHASAHPSVLIAPIVPE